MLTVLLSAGYEILFVKYVDRVSSSYILPRVSSKKTTTLNRDSDNRAGRWGNIGVDLITARNVKETHYLHCTVHECSESDETSRTRRITLIMMLMPRLMNGLLKSITFSLSAMMVSGAIARSTSYNASYSSIDQTTTNLSRHIILTYNLQCLNALFCKQ